MNVKKYSQEESYKWEAGAKKELIKSVSTNRRVGVKERTTKKQLAIM